MLKPMGRFLRFFDDGNQRAMNHLRSQPNAGIRMIPYAKSESARRAAICIIVVIGLVGMAFGIWWAALALAVMAPILWRLEHHFFLRRRQGKHSAGQDEQTEPPRP